MVGVPVSYLEERLALLLGALGIEMEVPGYEREYRFHSTRRWRFDFAWPELLLAVEVEGGIWSQGRHTRGQGFEDDCEKYNEAALAGWRVLRVTGGQIARGEAIEWIARGLQERGVAGEDNGV